ncbi:high mobility group B protein 9-like [Impatiens glandulifera]|uniref:high mobility group B protein 9-like n=1 Tax=Impatiens glandulifera TaxID=253017 RepID=UPI001FB0AD8B|nr:high mobility group B protein 9-like [Impatiens glandulifera]
MSTPAPPTTVAPAGKDEKRRPLAAHEDMVKDPAVFWDALSVFHSHKGTKIMVPVIGGKELNLHVLYVEVTSKGGYDKVVLEKKWREVSSVFSFSPTTTSASYALRKHYFSLLYHFELAHFLHREFSLDSSLTAIGTIDGKFDCGYMVTVKLGSETLNGVLYYPDESSSSTTPVPVKPCTAIVPFNIKETGGVKRRSRRRKRGGDPNRPKPNRSGYNFFFAEKHASLKTMYPEKEKERQFTKMIGESWNKLTAEERVVYQNYGLKDKERYQRELKEYTDRMKMVAAAGEGCSVSKETNN